MQEANQLDRTDLDSTDVVDFQVSSCNSQLNHSREDIVVEDAEDYVRNVIPNLDVEMDDEDDNLSDIDANQSDSDFNPLKQIVIKAVLDALKKKYESGTSVKTFTDVLDYGKKLLFTSLSKDVGYFTNIVAKELE